MQELKNLEALHTRNIQLNQRRLLRRNKKAIHLSKEDLIDFLIELNEDNNRLHNIVLDYERATKARVERFVWTPEKPYCGYNVNALGISYTRDVEKR